MESKLNEMARMETIEQYKAMSPEERLLAYLNLCKTYSGIFTLGREARGKGKSEKGNCNQFSAKPSGDS